MATIKLVSTRVYAVIVGGDLVYADNTLTGAIVWALQAGYEVEVQG